MESRESLINLIPELSQWIVYVIPSASSLNVNINRWYEMNRRSWRMLDSIHCVSSVQTADMSHASIATSCWSNNVLLDFHVNKNLYSGDCT